MDAAAAALIGAGIGAIVPTVATGWTAWHQNKPALEQLQDARDARLFDHRREAYAQFISETNQLASALNRHFMDGEPLEDNNDRLRPTIDRLALVQLYGTPTSSALASAAFSALAKYGYQGRENSGLVFNFQVAIDEFTDQARSDLGVPSSRVPEGSR